MRTLQYLITAAIATAIAFSSCKKEAESPQEPDQEANFSRETGAPIIFGASSVYDNPTKAEYSGEVYEGKERIDWVAKDQMRIFCKEAANCVYHKDGDYYTDFHADYEVAGAPTPLGFKSMASIKSSTPEADPYYGGNWGKASPLKWGEENTHIFYAIYPYRTYESYQEWDLLDFGADGPLFQARARQEMYTPSPAPPIMVGFAAATKDGSSPVTLNFSPIFTTFDIELKNSLSPITLERVELYSHSNPLAETFGVKISRNGEITFDMSMTAYNQGVNFIYYNFSQKPTLNHNETMRLQFHTRPEDIEKLTLRIIGKREGDDTEKTWILDFKKNEKWIRFEKLKKHNLRNIEIPASDEFNNKLELNPNSSNLDFAPGGGQPIGHPVEVKSYTENKDGTKVYPLPWGIFYRNDAWIDKDMSQLIYPAAPDNGFTKMNLFMKETAPLNQDYVQKLNAMKALPAKNNWDLSLFGATRYTANCYIVNSKGTYKFPLAYGNACKSDVTNDESFTCMHSGENLQIFKNGAGEPIGDPFFTANKVELVWEDSPGLIETLSLGRPGEDPQDNRLQFVHFSIGEKIDFGNAIIAVKNENNVTIWTWHIWVIDINQEDIFNLPDKQLFNYPLGYRPKKWDYSEPYSYDIEVKQLDVLDAKDKFFEVTKIAGFGYASCLYYTYGRLTPLMPTKRMYFDEPWTENSETTVMIEDCYTASFDQNGVRGKTRIVPLKNATGRKTLSEAINVPAEICLLSKSYDNLWNNRRTASTNTEVGVFIKTVYDPCPVGLMVPSIAYYDDKVNKAARWEDWKMGAYTDQVENTYPEKYDHTVRNFSECVYFHTSDTPFKNAAGGVLSTDLTIRHLPILPIRGE